MAFHEWDLLLTIQDRRKDEVLQLGARHHLFCVLPLYLIYSTPLPLMNNSPSTNTSHVTKALPLNMFRLKSYSKYSKFIWVYSIISHSIFFLHSHEHNALLVRGLKVECPSRHKDYRINGTLAYMTAEMSSNSKIIKS